MASLEILKGRTSKIRFARGARARPARPSRAPSAKARLGRCLLDRGPPELLANFLRQCAPGPNGRATCLARECGGRSPPPARKLQGPHGRRAVGAGVPRLGRIPWAASAVAGRVSAIRGRCWHEGLGIRRQRRYGRRLAPGPLHEASRFRPENRKKHWPRNDGSFVRPRRWRPRGRRSSWRDEISAPAPRREQAPAALRHLRRRGALVAESFAGLFYRNALNLGFAGSRLPTGRAGSAPAIRLTVKRGKPERSANLTHRGDRFALRADPRPPHARWSATAGCWRISRKRLQYDPPS